MNLHKAIQIGELNIALAGKKMPPDTKDALILLVESGQAVQNARNFGVSVSPSLLPSETPNGASP